ncbi:hypothetical protein [Neoaquamicrobium sediminum]|uniref:hypothetical protein n=1 Tax=Neoaquamicrobium sediminum TaxID=1849104 RepID=UPI004035E82E
MTDKPLLLSATDAAKLLGVGRTHFWKLRKQFNLQRVSWSTDIRPLYRREDVLNLVTGTEGHTTPHSSVEQSQGREEGKARERVTDPARRERAGDHFGVTPGDENLTVDEWLEQERKRSRKIWGDE